MHDLSRLLRPASIAVFGGKEALRVIEQSRRVGFTGPIWPVHPKYDFILGERCYRTVKDLPGVPDAAFVGVNRHVTVEIVGALAAAGAGGAVCYASGFREASQLDDGGDLQAALIHAAGDMPIIGPNCYGFINILDGALLWPDQHGLKPVNRGVAILTQSSNIAINLSMQQRGLPIAYIATAGNQAQIGISDLAVAMLDDPRVTAIGVHIEGIDDITALERLAGRARALGKPIIALKVGLSEAAQAASVSHTASIAGGSKASSALFARLGIAEVTRLPELVETLKLLHKCGPLPSPTISSMSCSGGEASLIADAAFGRDIHFSPIAERTHERLATLLGDMVTVTNPLDYHTFIWADLGRQTEVFSAMMAGEQALNLVLLDLPRMDRCDPADWEVTVEATIAATKRTGAKAAIVATLPENMPEPLAEALMAEGNVIPLNGIDETLTAVEAAAAIGRCWSRPMPAPLLNAVQTTTPSELLDEADAKMVLAGYGLPVPDGRRCKTIDEAVLAAQTLGFPIAIKALGIAHKTEAGAVRLSLMDEASAEQAANALLPLGDGLLVERMAKTAVAELIVGIVRDPAAGLVLSIGAGGILVELIEDSTVLTLPTDRRAILDAIAGLRIFRLLNGYRGTPAGDIEALVTAIEAIADYARSEASTIEEVDINPLLVLPAGEGVIAVDALVKRRKKP